MTNKLLDNADILSEHELLEVLLFYALPRKDTNEIAHKILSMFGSLDKVLSASSEQLMAVDGVGKSVASEIRVVGSIYRRIAKNTKKKQVVSNFLSAKQILTEYFNGCLYEKFVMILMNKNFEVLAMIEVSDKETHKVSADIPELTLAFNIHKPTYVILSHNHTSGNPLPSKEDDLATKKINLLCEIHDICLTDHIIVAGEKTYSYEREGRLYEIKENSTLTKLFENIENKPIDK